MNEIRENIKNKRKNEGKKERNEVIKDGKCINQ